MPNNFNSTIRPLPSATAVSATAPISAAPSAHSVIEGFNSAASAIGFGSGFEPSLHGNTDILSPLVDRLPTVAVKTNPLLSVYKSLRTPSIGAPPRPTPAALAPTDLGAHLMAESIPGEGVGVASLPSVHITGLS